MSVTSRHYNYHVFVMAFSFPASGAFCGVSKKAHDEAVRMLQVLPEAETQGQGIESLQV